MVTAPTVVRKVLVLVTAEIKGKPYLLQYQSPDWGGMPLIPNVNHDGALDGQGVGGVIAQRLGISAQSVVVHEELEERLDVEKVSASSGKVKLYEYILVPATLRRIPSWLREVGEPDRSEPPRALDDVYYSWWPLNRLKADERVTDKNAKEVDFISKSYGSNLLQRIPRSRFDVVPELLEYRGAGELLVAQVEAFLQSEHARALVERIEGLEEQIKELRERNRELEEVLKQDESVRKRTRVRALAVAMIATLAVVADMMQVHGFFTESGSPDLDIEQEVIQVVEFTPNFDYRCEALGVGYLDPSNLAPLEPDPPRGLRVEPPTDRQ